MQSYQYSCVRYAQSHLRHGSVQYCLVLTTFFQVCHVYKITIFEEQLCACFALCSCESIWDLSNFCSLSVMVTVYCPSQVLQWAISNLVFGIHRNHNWFYINKCFSCSCTLQKLEIIFSSISKEEQFSSLVHI